MQLRTLITIALCVLALPVRAEEKAWHCSVVRSSEITFDAQLNYDTSNFKFLVSAPFGADGIVTFGDGGYFDGREIPMVGDTGFWFANVESRSFYFSEPRFMYSFRGSTGIYVLLATCDDF